jgi:hypothetical protein
MSVILTWGIKQSLRDYITSLPDGSIDIIPPATEDSGSFSFVAENSDSFSREEMSGTLEFSGVATLSGYGGAMRIEINNPRIHLTNGQGLLSLTRGGVIGPATWIPLVELKATLSGDALICHTTLVAPGRSIVGEQYQDGQEFDSLTISFDS